MKYYIIWSDYDGCNIEEYGDEEKAASRFAELINLQSSLDSNGIEVHAAILGQKLGIEEVGVKVVAGVRFFRRSTEE